MISQNEVETKAAVSVSEMARMVSLSRQRFAQLQGTTFPWPLYDLTTRRPFYPEELQRVCLEVRRRNCGIDGRPVLFYARRLNHTDRLPQALKPAKDRQHTAIIDGLKELGMSTVKADEVTKAIRELFSDDSSKKDPTRTSRCPRRTLAPWRRTSVSAMSRRGAGWRA